jgi:hypothetical protein
MLRVLAGVLGIALVVAFAGGRSSAPVCGQATTAHHDTVAPEGA